MRISSLNLSVLAASLAALAMPFQSTFAASPDAGADAEAQRIARLEQRLLQLEQRLAETEQETKEVKVLASSSAASAAASGGGTPPSSATPPPSTSSPAAHGATCAGRRRNSGRASSAGCPKKKSSNCWDRPPAPSNRSSRASIWCIIMKRAFVTKKTH